MVSDGDMADNIRKVQGLTSRRPIGKKGGSMSGRISKQLIYGDQKITETQIKIEGVRGALKDFVRTQN